MFSFVKIIIFIIINAQRIPQMHMHYLSKLSNKTMYTFLRPIRGLFYISHVSCVFCFALLFFIIKKIYNLPFLLLIRMDNINLSKLSISAVSFSRHNSRFAAALKKYSNDFLALTVRFEKFQVK